MNVERVRELWQQLDTEIGRVVIGQSDTLRHLTVALLAGGHVLLEGAPGTGKTLLASAFAGCLGLEMKRIQFTPDLMPGDIVGTNLFDFQNNRFNLTRGPVFTEVLLADEINRTPPKTQSALLEAMQERAVTVDGRSYELPRGFFVLATENPIEHDGTYPLPEAQLDRFMFKLLVGYPAREAELDMVRTHGHRTAMPRLADLRLPTLVSREELDQVRAFIEGLRVADDVLTYIVDLVRATREHPSLRVGGSPRACNVLASASRALACLDGRDFVLPDDVKSLLLPVLRHRVVLSSSVEIEGTTTEDVLQQIATQVPAPR